MGVSLVLASAVLIGTELSKKGGPLICAIRFSFFSSSSNSKIACLPHTSCVRSPVQSPYLLPSLTRISLHRVVNSAFSEPGGCPVYRYKSARLLFNYLQIRLPCLIVPSCSDPLTSRLSLSHDIPHLLQPDQHHHDWHRPSLPCLHLGHLLCQRFFPC